MTTGIKLPVASATQEGMVSTGSQTFAGAKTLTGLTTVGVAATANNHKVYGNLQLTASESVGGTNAIQIFAADNPARFSIDSSGSATWYAAGAVLQGILLLVQQSGHWVQELQILHPPPQHTSCMDELFS